MAFVTTTSTATPVGTGIAALLFTTLVASTLWLCQPYQGQETKECSALINRGRAAAHTGNYNLAESLFKQAVQCGSNPKCAQAVLAESLNELARIEIAQWQEHEAVAHARQSLQIYTKLAGDCTPEAIQSLTTLGEAIYGVNDNAEAERLLGDAISKCDQQKSPQNNLLKAQALDELALVDFSNGNYNATEQHAVEGYNLRRQNAAGDEPIIESLTSIGWVQFYQDKSEGHLEKAISNLEQAAKIAETKVGANHPQLGLVLYDLAQVYESAGNQKASQAAQLRAHQIFSNSLRPDHPLLSS